MPSLSRFLLFFWVVFQPSAQALEQQLGNSFVSNCQKLSATDWQEATQSRARVVVCWRGVGAEKVPAASFPTELRLGLHISLNKGWHTYWTNPGQSGATPRLKWTIPEADRGVVRTSESTRHPVPERHVLGPITTYVHHGEVVLFDTFLKNQSLSEGSWSLAAEYLVCTEEQCIPAKAHFEFSPFQLDPTSPDSFKLGSKLWPQPGPEQLKLNGVLNKAEGAVSFVMTDTPPLKKSLRIVDVFDRTGSVLSEEKSGTQQAVSQQMALSLSELEKGNTVPFQGLVLIEDIESNSRSAYEVALALSVIEGGDKPDVLGKEESMGVRETSPLLMLVFALLGGLLLNLMPCVFPVLSLKAFRVAQLAAENPRSGGQGEQIEKVISICFALGVVTTFLFMGLVLVGLRAAGHAVGWGFQLQSLWFNVLLCYFFLALALNFFGVGPAWFQSVGFASDPSLAGTNSAAEGPARRLRREFFTGALSVVVASPCTAPFMSTALGFALLQASAPMALAVFGAMGVGMALPLSLLEFVPGLGRLLPRPGVWMKRFQQALGFPLLGTVVWLLWVCMGQSNGFSVEVYLLGFVSFAFFVWLVGWVRRKWLKGFLLLFAALIVVFSVTRAFQIEPSDVRAEPAGRAENRLEFRPFLREEVDGVLAKGKPVFIDFTARWCVTCQVNKVNVFQNEKVVAALKGWGVVTFRADWTNYSGEITEELKTFGKVGVPLYVYYPAGKSETPVVLPQILTVDTFLETIESGLKPKN